MAMTVRQIPGQLQDGTMVTVNGTTSPSSNKFSINFSTGQTDIGTCDVGLHADVRFSEGVVVRNSFINGQWGNEERGGPGLPIQKGQPFESIILVKNDQFMISVNGQHYGEFRHRLPKERNTFIIVKGDVQVNNVSFAGPGMSGGAPGGFGGPQGGSGFGAPQQGGFGQPGGPQKKNIPGGLQPGRIVYINGTAAPNGQGFELNLKFQDQGGDIALHFKPRFNEKATIINSCIGGNWGQEVRPQAPFPFVPGAPFQMMVLPEPNQFKIAVNGAHYAEYPFRGQSLQAVQFVEVNGDVSSVQINTP